MNTTPYNIAHDHTCLTADEMELFLERRLESEHYARAIRHLRHCEYCAEAAAGLGRMADRSVLAGLPAAWHARTGIRVPTGQNRAWRFLKPALWAGLAVFMAIWAWNVIDEPVPRQANTSVPAAPPVAASMPAPRQTANAKPMPDPVEETGIPPAEHQVVTEGQAIGKLEKREAYIHNPVTVTVPPAAKTKSGIEHSVIYIEGLKVYEDPGLFSPVAPGPDIQKNHIPARYEDAGSKTEEPAVARVSYRQALTSALRDYRAGRHAEALAMLNSVMDAVPGDLNAAFYRALILEELGRYESASASFAAIAVHRNDVFGEEAAFHEALCELTLGRKEKAKKILSKIAESRGFYAERARAIGREVE